MRPPTSAALSGPEGRELGASELGPRAIMNKPRVIEILEVEFSLVHLHLAFASNYLQQVSAIANIYKQVLAISQ